MTKKNTLTDMDDILFDTLRDLRDDKISIETAKAINETAQTIINRAKAEIDYLRVTDGRKSTTGLLDAAPKPLQALPNGPETKAWGKK